ncbi:hypothetical protein PTSG_09438 [Salpingoeca rosetta]|uniref:Uncharacterized protein n=1 Tax=Salpingoeca rosetta (strain ATCC 50818 / BSB-021) TaxID=946362 RepID=F2UMM2_SALR5|nr:uncharacterized protein PTSG_09438 [Salpingoeca rosetta]EGD78371.1 hypothetical protein PTSG_09438 [Salpingoeca rosetta]|eukprot:XP_004989694.1 hypothetical protein PTSG_09438 [Salpingoeca rosetta]
MKPLLSGVDEVAANVANALVVDERLAADTLRSLTSAFSLTAKQLHVDNRQASIQHKLMTHGFDEEQIWAQIELMNEPIFDMLSSQLEATQLESARTDVATLYEQEDRDEDEAAYEDAEGFDDEGAALEDEEEDEGDEEDVDKAGTGEDEHESDTDAKALGLDDDDDDEFEGMTDDDDDMSGDEELTIEDLKKMTSFQRHQHEIKKQIQELEQENVAEKTWQMSGEADARVRPENSLLEEFLEYDHVTAPPPPMTEEQTEKLEDVIKQRIVDNIFDDVERRFEEDLENEQKQLPDVLKEKSKLSLAEVYEQDFLEATQGAVTSAAERRVQRQHKAVKQLMMSIEDELNALTNAHYLPMRPKEDLSISTSAPVVTMEDVTPTAVGANEQKAPEEVAKKELVAIGEEEATDTDRKRERRKKKKKQHDDRIRREKFEDKLDRGQATESAASAKQRALTKLKDKAKQNEANITILDGSVSVDEQLAKNKIFQSLKRQVEKEADAITGARKKKAKRSSKSGAASYKL